MQEYQFSNHEAQIQILQNQARTNRENLLQLIFGFRSPMEIAALATIYRENPQCYGYIIIRSLNAFLQGISKRNAF